MDRNLFCCLNASKASCGYGEKGKGGGGGGGGGGNWLNLVDEELNEGTQP